MHKLTPNDAATTLQNTIKNHQTRKEVRNKQLAKSSNEKQAATTLQTVFRGHQEYKEFLNEEQRQQRTTNILSKLTRHLKQEQDQQRLGAVSMKPVQHQGGTRSGVAFRATEALNSPSRMQLHRETNPNPQSRVPAFCERIH